MICQAADGKRRIATPTTCPTSIYALSDLPALLAALRDLGDAPTRSLTALARRLGVPEAVAVVAALPEEPRPVSPPLAAPVAGPLSPAGDWSAGAYGVADGSTEEAIRLAAH